MWPQAAVVVVLATAALSYQPTRVYDPTAALNYQKQILQWQQTVGRRSPYTSYSLPWATRGYGLYRQDADQGTVSSQPATGPLDNVAPVQELNNNQVIPVVEPTQTPPSQGPQNPLRALCKAPRGQFIGTSCGKFVNCWDDFVVEQDCPLGLSFNEKAGYCDFAWNVPCTNPPVYQPDSVEGPGGEAGPGQGSDQDLGAPGAKCPTEFGTYRSSQNCGVFYMCVGYQPFEFTCPGGLNFHKDLQVCDYPYRVECHGVPSNTLPPETTLVPEGETTPAAPPATIAELAPPAPAPELPPTPAIVAPEPTPAAPVSTSPEAFYLKKIPASLMDSAVPCHPSTVYRLNPSCSSVAVCRNGFTQVLNCGPGTSFDVYSDRCVPSLRARC